MGDPEISRIIEIPEEYKEMADERTKEFIESEVPEHKIFTGEPLPVRKAEDLDELLVLVGEARKAGEFVASADDPMRRLIGFAFESGRDV